MFPRKPIHSNSYSKTRAIIISIFSIWKKIRISNNFILIPFLINFLIRNINIVNFSAFAFILKIFSFSTPFPNIIKIFFRNLISTIVTINNKYAREWKLKPKSFLKGIIFSEIFLHVCMEKYFLHDVLIGAFNRSIDWLKSDYVRLELRHCFLFA